MMASEEEKKAALVLSKKMSTSGSTSGSCCKPGQSESHKMATDGIRKHMMPSVAIFGSGL